MPGPKYALRISDLHTWQLLRAKCCICGHTASIRLKHRDPHAKLIDIEPKLRCSKCGHRGMNFFEVGPVRRMD